MSVLTLHQLERIAGMIEDIIAKAPPKHPRARKLVVRLAALDQVITERKDRKGEVA